MSALFKVGEICVMQNCIIHPENNGREVTIVDVGMLGIHGGAAYFGYQVDFLLLNGFACVARPDQLRRRIPPVSDTGEQRIIAMIRDAKAPQRVGEPA